MWLKGLLNVADSIPAVTLVVAILILSGPTRLLEPETKRQLTNIEFCIDISGSMMAPFGEGSRYDASMQAINDFLDIRTGDAFGLTFFGNSVLHWTPITTDPSELRRRTVAGGSFSSTVTSPPIRPSTFSTAW